MKNLFTMLCIALSCGLMAQSNWRHDYLTISNVKEKSYTLANRFDNHIKIKFFKRGNFVQEFLIQPKNDIKLTYDIDYFTEVLFKNYEIKVFYDDECYNADLQVLNRIAQQRVNKEKSRQETVFLFRLAAELAEGLSEKGSNWEAAGKAGNAALDIYEAYYDVKQNGFTEATLNYLTGAIQDKIIDRTIQNKYERTIINGLRGLYNYQNSSVKINTSDLDAAAIEAFYLISNQPMYEYTIDYRRTILPKIDGDFDGVLNRDDNCPSEFGLKKYKGCSRATHKRIVRNKRKRNAYNVFFDWEYVYAHHGLLAEENTYAKNYHGSGYNLNLQIATLKSNLGKRGKGTFFFTGSFQRLKGYAGLTDEKDHHIYDRKSAIVGVAYGILFNQYSKAGIMMIPEFGAVVYNNISCNSLTSTTTGDPVPKDLFMIEDGYAQYYGLRFRYFPNKRGRNRGKSQPSFGLTGSVRYLDQNRISLNPDYNYSVDAGGIEFEHPENTVEFSFGVSLVF